ncbi:MAG: hypothetical protein H3C68_03555 [Deltaproteobacteria bacterium]|nr:hypothetical protein [Deltaproteobacteria bacterium]MBZ0219801.1 hypothetical protein [Deltaproteobacteria bacterium]
MGKSTAFMLIIVGALAINLGTLCKNTGLADHPGAASQEVHGKVEIGSHGPHRADPHEGSSNRGNRNYSAPLVQSAYADCDHQTVHCDFNLGRTASEPGQPGQAAPLKVVDQSFASIAPVPQDRPPCISV